MKNTNMERNIFGLTGWSGSGKTTLLERLIPVIKEIACRDGRKNFRIAVIKHDAHGLKLRPAAELYEDAPGKDSWRFRQAGADQVVLFGSEGMYVSADPLLGNLPAGTKPEKDCLEEAAVFYLKHMTGTEKAGLETALQYVSNADLIFIEGFKGEAYSRIGILRKETRKGIPGSTEDYLAIVTDDQDLKTKTPLFQMEDITGIAQFIWNHLQDI